MNSFIPKQCDPVQVDGKIDFELFPPHDVELKTDYATKPNTIYSILVTELRCALQLLVSAARIFDHLQNIAVKRTLLDQITNDGPPKILRKFNRTRTYLSGSDVKTVLSFARTK